MHNDLDKIGVQFLCGFPVNEISFSDLVLPIESQEYLLNKTVNSDIVVKYPVNINYQKAFLKCLLNIIEKRGVEVCDELYSTYGRLVALPESSPEYYKHYCAGESTITLVENVNLISDGTTGLRTWQASLALAEWCLNNKEFLRGKTILELGSGIGLAGLVATKECKPKKFYFSDCHPQVLKTLVNNVLFNFSSSLDKHNISFDNNYSQNPMLNVELQSGTNIVVLNLPWETVDSAVCEKLGKIDLLVAADVVFDSALFEPLVNALICLWKKCYVTRIVFACAERNPETLDQFLHVIGKHFKVCEESCPSQKNFVWSTHTPVKLISFELI